MDETTRKGIWFKGPLQSRRERTILSGELPMKSDSRQMHVEPPQAGRREKQRVEAVDALSRRESFRSAFKHLGFTALLSKEKHRIKKFLPSHHREVTPGMLTFLCIRCIRELKSEKAGLEDKETPL